jgi:hypothetical protein
MSSRLTLRQATERVRHIVDEYLDSFGLVPEWSLSVSLVARDQMHDKEADAEIGWPRSYRSAQLRVNADHARTAPIEQLRRTLRHELLHLVLAPLIETIEAHVGEETVVGRAVDRSVETVVDRLTHLLVD